MPGHLDKVRLAGILSALLLPVTLGEAATHTLSGNASTAVALDNDLMVVGDDEDQILRIYHRRNDGPPIYQRDFSANLALTDISPAGLPREVDIEASVKIGNLIYWLGSHGNCGGCDPPGELRPNRNRLFATRINGSGTNTTLTYVGRYHNLKRDLIAWDNTNGHGLGAGFLQLEASAVEGVPPETAARDGFNIEGFAAVTNGTQVTAYIGFRSPLTARSGRTNALIIPLLNLPQLVIGSPAPGPARFGRPIELFLDRRGIRSIESVSNGFVMVAGTTTNSGTFRIYTWSGNTNDPALERQANFTVVQPEGLIVASSIETGSEIQLISEGGNSFRSQFVTIGTPVPQLANTLMAQGTFRFLVFGRPGGIYDIERSENGGPWTYVSSIQIAPTGQTEWSDTSMSTQGRRLYRARYPSLNEFGNGAALWPGGANFVSPLISPVNDDADLPLTPSP